MSDNLYVMVRTGVWTLVSTVDPEPVLVDGFPPEYAYKCDSCDCTYYDFSDEAESQPHGNLCVPCWCKATQADDETCDGCGQPGATCEYDGYVFHDTTCWVKAEQRYTATLEGGIARNVAALAATLDDWLN